MANLNFQQPPRSIASSVLNNSRQSINGGNAIGNSAGAAGFVIGNSLSGHVTPTTGMFSQNSNNLAGANSIGGGGGGGNNTNNSFNSNNMPAQLSPNRSVQMPPGGGVGNIGGGLGLSVGGGLGQGNMGPAQQMSQRTSIFGQRTNFSDRRPIQGLGTMVSVVFSRTRTVNHKDHTRHVLIGILAKHGLVHAVERLWAAKRRRRRSQQLSLGVWRRQWYRSAVARSVRIPVAHERARQRLDATTVKLFATARQQTLRLVLSEHNYFRKSM